MPLYALVDLPRSAATCYVDRGAFACEYRVGSPSLLFLIGFTVNATEPG